MTASPAGKPLMLAVVGVPLLVIAGLAVAYTQFAVPVSDDFCRAAVAPGDAFRQTATLYNVWTGRWLASLFFSWTTPRIGIFGPGYGLALIAGLGVWLIGFRLAAGLVLGPASGVRDRWLLAILLLAVFWSGTPGINEAVYWFSGAFEYGIPFLLLVASWRLLASADGSRRGLATAMAAGGTGFIAAGAHEFAGALCVGSALCGAAAFLFLGKRRVAAYWFFAAMIVVAGLALNRLAPGNQLRNGLFPHAGDVGRSLRIAFSPESTPLRWLADMRLIALFCLLPFCIDLDAQRRRWSETSLPWLLLIPGVTVAATLSGWFLAAYGIGFAPPGRLQALFYAVFIIGWTATVFAGAARIGPGLASRWTGRPAALAAAALFGVALLASGNTRAAMRDFNYARGAWLSENTANLAAVRSAVALGKSDLILRTPGRTPELLMRPAYSEDPADYGNRCLAGLLQARSVRAAPGEGTKRLWRGE
ncbi:MAG TPA: DUF6056 family protein [Allosphingosinicella sp.]